MLRTGLSQGLLYKLLFLLDKIFDRACPEHVEGLSPNGVW